MEGDEPQLSAWGVEGFFGGGEEAADAGAVVGFLVRHVDR